MRNVVRGQVRLELLKLLMKAKDGPRSARFAMASSMKINTSEPYEVLEAVLASAVGGFEVDTALLDTIMEPSPSHSFISLIGRAQWATT